MLQRMQSVWLLLAAICAFLTFKFSFFSGNIEVAGQPVSFQSINAVFNIWILIVTVIIASVAAIDIFLYKNRKLQLRLAIVGLILSILDIYLYYNQTHKFSVGKYDLTAVLSLIIPVFFFFAIRGIYRDQKLVKSLDRLR